MWWAQRDSNPRHLPCTSPEFLATTIDRFRRSHVLHRECSFLSPLAALVTMWHDALTAAVITNRH